MCWQWYLSCRRLIERSLSLAEKPGAVLLAGWKNITVFHSCKVCVCVCLCHVVVSVFTFMRNNCVCWTMFWSGQLSQLVLLKCNRFAFQSLNLEFALICNRAWL